VAVFDTGIDKDHPDLVVAGGVNYIVNKGKIDPNAWDDDNGHGTHCAGIIAAQHNGKGIKGIAPSVKLYAVKVMNKLGNGWYSDFIKGLDWAKHNGIKVVSMSFGGSGYDGAFDAACSGAMVTGIILIAAAGNTGTNSVLYPAKFGSVMAISSVDSSSKIAATSAYGPEIDLAAPGVSIYSTYNNGGYATMSGTSMACPHVAGTAAQILGEHGSLSVDNLIGVLIAQGEDLGTLGRDDFYGHGLVDAQAAYNSV